MLQRRTPDGPVLQVTIAPKMPADRDRLAAALAAMAARDSSLTYIREGIGRMILGGGDELHLDRAVHTLAKDHGFDLAIGAPEVGYRERVRRPVEIDHTHKRQFGGGGVFARVLFRFEPGEPGSRLVFQDNTNAAVPAHFVDAVREGLERARLKGLVAGFPVIELKATLRDGAYHEMDSSADAFMTAAKEAFLLLRDRSAVELLEPVMAVEVTTPDEFIGSVIGDLNARRGQVEGTEHSGDRQVITALVPVATMFGHHNVVMALTRGRAQVEQVFDHYEPVPRGFSGGPDRFPPAAAKRA